MRTSQALTYLRWILPLLLAAASIVLAVTYPTTYEGRQALGGPALRLRYESGYAYVADLPRTGPSETVPSSLSVLEDGSPLVARDTRRNVRRILGSYLEADGRLYLSTRDGSDPRANGRRYELAYRRTYVSGVHDTQRRFSLALAAVLAAILNAAARLSIHRHPLTRRSRLRGSDR